MDDVYDLDTIDVELDEYFKRKPIFRCKDEFLNILCEEDDDANNGAQPQNNKQESDSEYVQGSDEEDIDDDFEYSTHNPKVKWNLNEISALKGGRGDGVPKAEKVVEEVVDNKVPHANMENEIPHANVEYAESQANKNERLMDHEIRHPSVDNKVSQIKSDILNLRASKYSSEDIMD
ncbi:unnamed protein product [Lactuca virosa]|uniref:Uncharacterized protein n=1 Tax=Lactuca virosa TaxID=75947 RepID=A0AAU9M7F8_9ASTR|nr:unnamed protein product [Lactuca virosa]